MTADELLPRYLSAIRAGDRRTAFGVVDDASSAGVDVPTLYLEVFAPALREIGRLWQENVITVADEHLATAITQAAMGRLYDRLFAVAPPPGRLLVAACADVERHELGLRMLCDLLELEGWDTVFLGATVPMEDLVKLVRHRQPQVVALSAALAPHLPRLRATVAALRAAFPDGGGPLIAVGGRPFVEDPGLCARVGGDFTSADASAAAHHLNERFPR